jgi:cellulose synthase/poly-beta-1,6-N-acetylglucosamine synthase-like glycosyltransferase
LFSFSIVIADNDDQQSAKGLVLDFAPSSSIDITYCVEPHKNIALARNKSLEYAKSDAIAIIDDDEYPSSDWLFFLFKALTDYRVAGVMGPIRPHFDTKPPAWLVRSRLCERPEHHTGFVMPWAEGRTGNVLFDKRIIEGMGMVFRPEFGISGSDKDLFRRLIDAGHTFIWCNEAVVYEVVSPNRWKRGFMTRRALLRGRVSILHPDGRWLNVLKSLLAVPAYGLALPFLQLLGHHLFMKYLVKLCDHLGRLLALVRLNPVRERDM